MLEEMRLNLAPAFGFHLCPRCLFDMFADGKHLEKCGRCNDAKGKRISGISEDGGL